MQRSRLTVGAVALTGWLAPAWSGTCPLDPAAPPATALTLRLPHGALRHVSEAEFAALPATERVQRRSVNAADAGTSAPAPALEQHLRYAGVLLRDVLAGALPAQGDRAARTWVFEAVATDGYRAVFAWGELFNSSAGEHVLVIASQDGRPLGTQAGPLALRALADLRPGPRHVRNLCGVAVTAPPR